MDGPLADPIKSFLPIGHCPSYLLSPLLTALEISDPNIALHILPWDGQAVESLMLEVCGLWSRIRQRIKEVKGPMRQVQERTE